MNNVFLVHKWPDATNYSKGFNDGNDPKQSGHNDFEYDDYGNMVIDRNKGITNITYNHLNLPKKITFENNQSIEYIYAADGSKLRKKVTDGTTNTNVDYLSGFQYTNEILEFFPHAEGYVTVNTNQLNDHYNYVFNYTDHLGNIRLKYTAHPQTGETQPLEENHYYPFGLTHDGYQPHHDIIGLEGANVTIILVSPNVNDPYKYKFGGKEYQEEFDVNVYDFGARNYDPALGRWMNVDPLAESYFTLSPYVYVANNPVLLRDPDGKRIEFSFTYDDEGWISSVNIHVTGKVIDNTKRGLSNKKMNSARDKIVDGINKIQVTGEGVDINFTSNIEIANKEDDIASDDHVYRLVDDVSKIPGIKHTNPKTKPIGAARVGENVMYLDKNYFTSRTAAHETGHSAGLFHIDETNERHLFPAAYAFADYMARAQGDVATRAYYRNSAMKMSSSRAYTGDDFYGNLMHQDATRNSRGQLVSGYLITRDQVNAVLYKYRNGQINKGKQE